MSGLRCGTLVLRLLSLMCCNVGMILCGKITTDVFHFPLCHGNLKDPYGGRISFNVAGSIHKDEKVARIPITIPYCMDLTYVNVAVDNPVGPPVVSLDRDLYVVTIKYRESQKSASTYSVTAKTVPIKQCYDFNNDGY